MNWLINAEYIPEFIPVHGGRDGLQDIMDGEGVVGEFENVDTPKRMINIDTGFMEDDPKGQYVILSHNWKGSEITYSYIQKARVNQTKREVYEMAEDDSDEEARRFARFQVKKYKHLKAGQNNVQLIGAQCMKDIEAQIRKIETIIRSSGLEFGVRELLDRLAEWKKASWDANQAKSSFSAQQEELTMSEMANVRFEKEKEDAKIEDPRALSGETDQNKLKEELAQAEEKLRQAEERLEKAKENCRVMSQCPGLLSAVGEMFPILERKKSMNKIEASIREARRILDTGLFPNTGQKRYLWNDTCCINKNDANETNVSLAMMGEWYNNADLCLVHLDTSNYTEWVETWDHLDKPAEEANFSSFDTIESPVWSDRGWTLQELVLSKMTFYVNSLWQPLSRPVEGLGPYYYHSAYLAHHLRDIDNLNVPPQARSILQDLTGLRRLMDTQEKVCDLKLKKNISEADAT